MKILGVIVAVSVLAGVPGGSELAGVENHSACQQATQCSTANGLTHSPAAANGTAGDFFSLLAQVR